ncbi:TPA: hypothetical protein ACGOQK_001695, partial [Streptococcus pyogenes]
QGQQGLGHLEGGATLRLKFLGSYLTFLPIETNIEKLEYFLDLNKESFQDIFLVEETPLAAFEDHLALLFFPLHPP